MLGVLTCEYHNIDYIEERQKKKEKKFSFLCTGKTEWNLIYLSVGCFFFTIVDNFFRGIALLRWNRYSTSYWLCTLCLCLDSASFIYSEIQVLSKKVLHNSNMKSITGSQFYMKKLIPQAFFALYCLQSIKRTLTPNFALRKHWHI